MRTPVAIIVFLIFFCIVFLGLHYTGVLELGFLKAKPQIAAHSYEFAPDETIQLLDAAKPNSSIRIHHFSGKVIVLNFWASWCLPCQEEFPLLIKLARENPDNLVLIAVSLDHLESAAKRFIQNLDSKDGLKNHSDNLYWASDPNWEIAKKFGVGKVPETYVIDKQLNMVKKIVGAAEWKGQKLWDEINGLVLSN
jgi:cytochrome c biogenesis protein CcmG/thiol:disulfide interchange protein DsbE